MDALITAASRALAGGDPLGALNRVALREDAPALALRGIAMAQLTEFERARGLLQRAARAFGRREPAARARCIIAEAEVALAARELTRPADALERARATLERCGDPANVGQAHYLQARLQLLTGQLDATEATLARLEPLSSSPATMAIHELLNAGIAIRRLRIGPAREALQRAREAAERARIPALAAEVDSAMQVLHTPAAQRITSTRAQPLRLGDVEALYGSDTLVVDACRFTVRHRDVVIALARRPVLFTLARALGEAWPDDLARDALIHRAFRLKHSDESLRGRLRVEIGRLRRALRPVAEVRATGAGFVLVPTPAREVAVLAPPVEEKHSAVLALLVDGEAWSSASLALALGTSQRSVQRALEALAAAGRVQGFGRGRARRWVAPSVPGFTTTLLLPAPLPMD